MGSKLSVLAALIASATLAVPGAARAAPTAADLMRQGADAFRAGRYEEAIAAIQQAYDLDPQTDTLFALAQAERLGGHCDRAIGHYKQVLSSLSDLEKAKLVQSNLSLCEKAEPEPAPGPTPTPVPAPTPTPPPAITATSSTEHPSDRLATLSLGAGALGIGAGIGLHLAANNSRDAAGSARTLGDSRELASRADRERLLSITSFVAGGALVGYAVYRWIRGPGEAARGAALAIHPHPDAPSIGVVGRW